MPNAANDRDFRVHARHVSVQHAHIVSEGSFEAAAVAYMEDYPHEISATAEISILVQEVASGQEHCFRVDIDTGETQPCS
jgi:hypothetical protein